MTHTSSILGGWLVLVLVLLCGCTGKEPATADRTKIGPAPGTYTIANGSSSVTIPFEYYGMNLMVHARTNGVDIDMLIDNGRMWDELWFYTTALADTLGLRCDGEVLITGAGEGDGVDSYIADNIDIAFGSVTFHDQEALISDASQGFDRYFPGMAGQVCGAFFKHFMVEFDFDTMLLTLHDPATFQYEGDGIALPMTPDSTGAYYIPLQVQTAEGQELSFSASIDLGGIYGLNLPMSAGFQKPDTERMLLAYGASGPIYGYRTTIPVLRVGQYEMHDVLTVLIENEDDDASYTVGLPVFKRYNLVFDYFHELLYVEPNSHFNTPFSEDERWSPLAVKCTMLTMASGFWLWQAAPPTAASRPDSAPRL